MCHTCTATCCYAAVLLLFSETATRGTIYAVRFHRFGRSKKYTIRGVSRDVLAAMQTIHTIFKLLGKSKNGRLSCHFLVCWMLRLWTLLINFVVPRTSGRWGPPAFPVFYSTVDTAVPSTHHRPTHPPCTIVQ